ncbi:MAG: hypothetical protein NVSMB68_13860 [Thermoanaerobaculia bacterium]
MNRYFVVTVFALFLALPLAAQSSRTQQLNARAFPAVVPSYLASIISDAATQYHVDPNLVAAMAFKESRFNPMAVSIRGAQGILQLMPRTAKSLGVTDSFDPKQNVLGGTKYIAQLLQRFNGNIELAVAAYNAGPELVAKAGPAATHEAVDYVAVVTSLYRSAINSL